MASEAIEVAFCKAKTVKKRQKPIKLKNVKEYLGPASEEEGDEDVEAVGHESCEEAADGVGEDGLGVSSR